METNYTLKKLIRGGTALLFLFAFMLTGSMTAFAQSDPPTEKSVTVNVVFDGDGVGVVTLTSSDKTVSVDGSSTLSFTQNIEGGVDVEAAAGPAESSFLEAINIAGVYEYFTTPPGTVTGNFATDQSKTVTVTFSKKKVQVDVYIADKVYDGNAYATIDDASTVTFTFLPHGSLAASDGRKTYTGAQVNKAASGTYTVSSGLATVTFAKTATPTVFEDRHAGTDKAATGTLTLEAGGDAANYTATRNVVNTATITAVDVAVGSFTFTPDDKLYDETDVVTSTVTIKDAPDGKLNAADVVAVAYTAQFYNKNVGTRSVTFEITGLSGAQAGNYALPTAYNLTTTKTADINPVTLTLASVEMDDVVFDVGTLTSSIEDYVLEGVLPGDVGKVGLKTSTGVVTLDEKPNPGGVNTATFVKFDIIQGDLGDALTGVEAGNYVLATNTFADVAITQGDVLEPVYAKFTPSFSMEVGNLTPTNVPLAEPLKITFTAEVYNPTGTSNLWDDVSEAGLTAYFDLKTGSPTFTVGVDIKVTKYDRSGGNVTFAIHVVEDGVKTSLKPDKGYKLSFNNVYYEDNGDFLPVKFRLDKSEDSEGNYVHQTTVGASYQDKKFVVFETAILPTVKPLGNIATVTPDIQISFANPIKFRTGSAWIPDADISDRFVLLESTDGADGNWELVDFTADPDDFQDVNGAAGTAGEEGIGPKVIDFNLPTGTTLKHNHVYMVGILPNADDSYGFFEIGTNSPVLEKTAGKTVRTLLGTGSTVEVATEFKYAGAPVGGASWTWTTDPAEYDIRVAVGGEQGTLYGVAGMFNFVDASAGTPGVAVVSETFANSVYVGSSTNTFDIIAMPEDGQHFLYWTVAAYGEEGIKLVPSTVTATIDNTVGPLDGNIGVSTLIYTAVFGTNTYSFTAGDIDADEGEYVADPTGEFSHGEYVTLKVTPEPGYLVSEWTASFDKTVGTVTESTSDQFGPANNEFSFRFFDTEFTTSGAAYVVTPTLTSFSPKVYGKTEPTGAASLTLTVDSGTLEGTGTDGFGRYWEVSPGSSLYLKAEDANDCRDKFIEWEIFDYEENDWVSHNDDNPLQITADYSVRYRAVYAEKDIMFAARPIDEDLGTIEVIYPDGAGGVATWLSTSAADLELEIGTTVTVTVFPEPNNVTYGWLDAGPIVDYGGNDVLEDGENIGTRSFTVALVGRPETGQKRSIWTVLVEGCENIDIQPKIALERYEVTVEVFDYTVEGAPVEGEGGVLVVEEDSYVPSYYVDYYKGFRLAREIYAERIGGATDVFEIGKNTHTFAKGMIPYERKLDDISVDFDDVNYNFEGFWQVIVGDDDIDLGIDLSGVEVTEDMVIEARFTKKGIPYTLAVVSDPQSAGTYEYEVVYAGIAGTVTGTVDAEGVVISVLSNVTTTVTVTATENDGYTFDNWTPVTGLTATTTLQTSFNMEDDVSLTAHFNKNVHNIEFKPILFTLDGDLVADPTNFKFEETETGGTVTATFADKAGIQTVTFGDDLILTETVNPGFKFVSWVKGKITGGGDLEGYMVSKDFKVPALPKNSDIVIFGVFVETAEEYPIYDLVVASGGIPNDIPGLVNYPGTYAHGIKALVNVDETLIPDGYNFTGNWDVEELDADDEWVGVATNVVITHVDMYSERKATALFAPKQYKLVVEEVDGYGIITVGTQTGTGAVLEEDYTLEDDPILLSAEALQDANGKDYTFIGWFYDEDGEEPVMDGDEEMTGEEWLTWYFNPVIPEEHMGVAGEEVKIYAIFSEDPIYYEVTLIANAIAWNSGIEIDEIELIGAGDDYEFNDKIIIEAPVATDLGYTFKRWTTNTGVVISTGRTFNHTVKDDVTFRAVYEYIDYTLTIDVEGEGYVSVNDGDFDDEFTGTFTVADPVAIEHKAKDGWEFAGWTDADGNDVDLEEDIFVNGKMPAKHVDLTANFEPKLFDIVFIILDEEEEELEDAVVEIIVDGVAVEYEEDMQLAVGVYTYTVTHPDYNSWTDNFEVEDGDVDVPVVEIVAFQRADAPDVLPAKATAFTAALNVDAEAWTLWMDDDGEPDVDDFEEVVGAVGLVKDLEPGTAYTFHVTTNITEAGYHKLSYAEPVTATTVLLGDVNADGDIMLGVDLAMMIDYIHGQLDEDVEVIFTADEFFADDKDAHEDEYFIFDAADINGDELLNIIDIVKWLRIYHGDEDDDAAKFSADADMYLAPGMIQLDSDGTLAGIQFELTGSNLEQLKLESMIPGFVVSWSVKDNTLTGIMFHPDAHIIEEGMVDLISVENALDLKWGHVFAANQIGEEVAVNTHEGETSVGPIASDLELNVFPNPSRGQFTTEINTPTASNVEFRLYDLTGRQVAQRNIVAEGYQTVSWNEDLQPGMYILRMVATPEGQPGDAVTREIRILINK